MEEMSAETKRFALELAEAVLACTPTAGLIEVLKLAFGKYVPKKGSYPPDEDPSMYKLVDDQGDDAGDPDNPDNEDLPSGATSTLDVASEAQQVASGSNQGKTGTKRKTRSGKVTQSKRARDLPVEKDDKFPLGSNLVAVYYPTIGHHSEHHIGVANELVGAREAYGHDKNRYRYPCAFEENANKVGLIVEDHDKGCDYFTQQMSATVTHIRRVHLGIALGCRFCDWRTYSRESWQKHMKKLHKSQEKEWRVADDSTRQGIKFEIDAEVEESVLLEAAK